MLSITFIVLLNSISADVALEKYKELLDYIIEVGERLFIAFVVRGSTVARGYKRLRYTRLGGIVPTVIRV